MGDIKIWSIPTMCQFPELFLMFLSMTSHKQTSKIPDIRFYLHFLRSGLWAWWAKLAYLVMLTIRGRLITPFILGSMSVGLNILIRHSITKTCLYKFDPLKPHFYIVKLGFTGVYIIFLISARNIDCGYSLEPPRQGGSNEYPQSMF